MKNLFVSLLFAVSWQGLQAQIPLPNRPLGFVYNNGDPNAPVHLEAFVDMLCPDSQQAFPVLEKLAHIYGPRTLRLTLQLFPLPYHTNAFVAAQVCKFVNINYIVYYVIPRFSQCWEKKKEVIEVILSVDTRRRSNSISPTF